MEFAPGPVLRYAQEARILQTQTEKLRTARLIWMLYYNRTLFDRGVITEDEFRRMRSKIHERYSPATVRQTV